MRLEFPYVRGRPRLTAKLSKPKGKSKYLEFLIDSGSDFTIIPRSDAMILGIDYNQIKSKEMSIEAANLSFMHGKEIQLNLEIAGEKFLVPVLVIKEEVERLLGRKGVFSKFDILFKEREEMVIFTSTKK